MYFTSIFHNQKLFLLLEEDCSPQVRFTNTFFFVLEAKRKHLQMSLYIQDRSRYMSCILVACHMNGYEHTFSWESFRCKWKIVA